MRELEADRWQRAVHFWVAVVAAGPDRFAQPFITLQMGALRGTGEGYQHVLFTNVVSSGIRRWTRPTIPSR